jgi:hypothetical protein
VRARSLYKQVFRVPFEDSRAGHRRLENVAERLEMEKRIAGEASRVLGSPVPAENIVVDVPERISFEIDIPVIGDPRTGPPAGLEDSSVFGRIEGVDFPRALRSVCVSARRDEALLAALARIDLHSELGA